MKKIKLFSSLLVIIISVVGFRAAQNADPQLQGAWQLRNGNEEQVILLADNYFTHTIYDRTNKKFIRTRGGSFAITGSTLNVQYEFDVTSSEQVGTTAVYQFSKKNKGLVLDINGKEENWQMVDDGGEGLSGLWKITARRQGTELQPIHQTGTRKTIKILTSTRFQWAAIDPGTKQFMGTGGGTYTFKDGKYTEHIEFFSRDSSRVGSSLSFDGKLEKGDWHHSGLSSKGDPIYEVWSRGKN